MTEEEQKSFQLEMAERGIHHDYWCDYEEEWLAEREELKQEIIEESKPIGFQDIMDNMFGDSIERIKAYNDKRIKE